jgi:hypothetical protein
MSTRGITISRADLERWAGRRLSDTEVAVAMRERDAR